MLVKVERTATAGERAQVADALDARTVRSLPAGWRSYELGEDVTLREARGRLAGAGAAAAVQLDSPLRALGPNDPLFPQQWALARIAADPGWLAAAGAAPVTVAVIDSGVDVSHPDLAARLWTNPGETPADGVDNDGNGRIDDVHGWNFAGENADLSDGDAHGTHVAGTVAAQRHNGQGIAGVADNGRVMPLKFLVDGEGTTTDAIAAIQYATAKGARVINASWGGDQPSPALCDAVAQAGAAGVVFVAAAGNAGTDNDAGTGAWPANCASSAVVSVAATTSGDGLAGFSNRGVTTVDLGAPGAGVLSTVPGGYAWLSGTSMAAPHVSGIAAAVLGMEPGLSPWQVKAAITTGGDPLPALVGTTASGRRANLLGALTVAGHGIGADSAAPDPFAALAPAPGLVTADPRPTFQWTPTSDSQSGIAGYRVEIDGAPIASLGAGATSVTPATALPEGAHDWRVVALDAEGNAQATDPRPLVLDRTAPSAPVPRMPGAGRTVAGPVVALTWDASTDAVSGVAGYRVVVDGAAVAGTGPGERSARLPLTRGRHIWQVVATDGAGNAAASAPRAFVVGGTAKTTRPVAAPAIRLGSARAIVAGRRPLLRVRLARRARVTFAVGRAGRAPLARFARRLAAGPSAVRMPPAVARRMSRPGVYLVTARIPGGRVDSVRIRVRPAGRR